MTPGPALAAKAEALHAGLGRTIVLGLAGPQGSGKSTAARAIVEHLEQRGLRAAVLGLDDLYLDREARAALAQKVHPLLRTRGPPGTHDVTLGLRVIRALSRRETVALPRFDKGTDGPRPIGEWPVVSGPLDVLVVEGWCVGARPQPPQALVEPVNRLEADEDPDGTWRRYCNTALAGDYQDLFARIDLYTLMRAPTFAVVAGWRAEQERELGPGRLMSDAEIGRFVQHYQRLTEWLSVEAEGRADVVIDLDADRRVGRSRGL